MRQLNEDKVIMKFSVRVSYPETGKYNWFEAVEGYKDIGLVEVASLILNYYDKTGLEINGVNGPIENWRFYYLYYYSNHIYKFNQYVFADSW